MGRLLEAAAPSQGRRQLPLGALCAAVQDEVRAGSRGHCGLRLGVLSRRIVYDNVRTISGSASQPLAGSNAPSTPPR